MKAEINQNEVKNRENVEKQRRDRAKCMENWEFYTKINTIFTPYRTNDIIF